jgi:hypothetical protein
MPRIPKSWLKLVVFIYADKASALGDQKGGGTGFFVGRQVQGGWQTFIITNRHVIDKKQNPVIRLNQMGTDVPDLCVTNRSRWIDHPDGDDLSVYPVDLDVALHCHSFIGEQGFTDLENYHLGLGSEVTMLGRFVGLSGQSVVRPVARFGSIAQPEIFKETNSFKKPQDTFVIECHTVPGFSGSPVLAYLPSNAASEEALENAGIGPFLLGVVWKHFGDPEDVLDEDFDKIGALIKGNSGLAGVIPAAKISKILASIDHSVSFGYQPPQQA